MTEPVPADGSPRTIAAAQDAIISEMSGLADWLGKYEYLVEQGRRLQVRDDGILIDQHAIPGCQSSVWIRADLQDGRIRLSADSDAMITRGIIALLLRVLNGHPPRDVLEADLYFLDRTGLRTHLSPARANGLGAMVLHIRSRAEEWAT